MWSCNVPKCSPQLYDDTLLNQFPSFFVICEFNKSTTHEVYNLVCFVSAENLIVCITRREFPPPAYCPCWASDLITYGTITTKIKAHPSVATLHEINVILEKHKQPLLLMDTTIKCWFIPLYFLFFCQIMQTLWTEKSV